MFVFFFLCIVHVFWYLATLRLAVLLPYNHTHIDISKYTHEEAGDSGCLAARSFPLLFFPLYRYIFFTSISTATQPRFLTAPLYTTHTHTQMLTNTHTRRPGKAG